MLRKRTHCRQSEDYAEADTVSFMAHDINEISQSCPCFVSFFLLLQKTVIFNFIVFASQFHLFEWMRRNKTTKGLTNTLL